MRRRALLLLAIGLAGCERRGTTASTEAGAMVSADAASIERPEPTLAPPPPPLSPPASGEARRSTLPTLEREPLLRPYLSTLREHFRLSRPDARGPFAMQRTELAGGRTAVLLSRVDESAPIVLVLDRDQMVWSKPRPAAGITPPFEHLTIAPRPDGGLVLFGYVAAMHLVAARMWADDGNAYAEIEMFAADVCDALAASYQSGQGWSVTCSARSGRQTRLLREDLTTAP